MNRIKEKQLPNKPFQRTRATKRLGVFKSCRVRTAHH